MLSARAYSFRQKSRLAILLSWIGGYCNVIALLACGAYASHVTGTVTNLADSIARQQWSHAWLAGYLWLTFLAGAASSAILTESARRRGMASKYIWPMAVEMTLLFLFALDLRFFDAASSGRMYLGMGIISFAMGLQNATITNVSGAVVRTTHLTGVTTDLGLEGIQYILWCRDQFRARRSLRVGRVLKVSQRHPGFLRVLLLASIIASFLLGALAGAFAFIKLGPIALGIPVAFLGSIIWRACRTPVADVTEIDPLEDSELKLFGIVKSLLPDDLGIWRISCRQHHAWHRPPDFDLWVERLPKQWRVIVLAFSPLTRFDRNAILDLGHAVMRLEREGRQLVLSGVTPGQYRAMVKADIARAMDVENLCPDLEFAVARALDLIGRSPHRRTDGRQLGADSLADAETAYATATESLEMERSASH